MGIAHLAQHRALATVVAGVACLGLALASCGAPDASLPQVPPGSLPAASPSLPRPTTVLGTPEEALARAFLAGRYGGSPDRFEILVTTTVGIADGRATLWSAKFQDPESGEIRLVYVTPGGVAMDPGGLAAYEAGILAGVPALERKADEALRAELATAAPTDRLQVGIWVRADTEPAIARVRERYPDVDWSDGLPSSKDAALIDEIRAAIYREKEAILRAAQAPVVEAVKAAGGEIVWQAGSAPLFFAILGPADLAALAERPDVVGIDLDSVSRRDG